jgi:hypothetical protein
MEKAIKTPVPGGNTKKHKKQTQRGEKMLMAAHFRVPESVIVPFLRHAQELGIPPSKVFRALISIAMETQALRDLVFALEAKLTEKGIDHADPS